MKTEHAFRIQIPAQKSANPSGLPDPEMLEHYNKIHPGFAERILVTFEKEQGNRHTVQARTISNQHDQHKRDTDTFRIGQVFALLAVVCAMCLCAYGMRLGYATQAATIATTVIVGLAAVFIIKNNKKEGKE